MSENTKIEWCDHTFNPWIGCTQVGPGCDNCYAKSWDRRFAVSGHAMHWGAGQARSRTKTWGDPVKWNKTNFYECSVCGWRGSDKDDEFSRPKKGCIHILAPARQRVFCASLADVFDNEVDPVWFTDLFELIEATPNLDWLLLTKRIGNVAKMVADGRWFPTHWPNVWLGATICNQAEADRDIPKLLEIPAAKRFLSMEPLLGPVNIDRYLLSTFEKAAHNDQMLGTECQSDKIDWVIVGGESGPNARPMHPDWARNIRDNCDAYCTPFLFKQWGNWRAAVWFDGPDSDNDDGDNFVDLDRTDHQFVAADGRTWDTFGGRYMYPPMPLGNWCLMVNEGKKAAGRLLDGREWNEVPA